MGDVIWYSMWAGFLVACLGFAAIIEVALWLRKRRIKRIWAQWAKADFRSLAGYQDARSGEPRG